MIKLSQQTFSLTRRRPLRISRGVSENTVNILVRLGSDDLEGWGGAAPFSTGEYSESAADIEASLERIADLISDCNPLDRQSIFTRLGDHLDSPSSAALAALDTALWDWLGKRCNLPLWQLWGLDLSLIPPTSVTVGMETPETAAEITRTWLSGELRAGQLYPGEKENKFHFLKVKLGSPQGIGADQARLEAVLKEAGDIGIMVDANAGWSRQDAIEMCHWLKARKVVMVEQPLPVAAAADWQWLHAASPLPLFADESCFTAGDVFQLAGYVDGVVVKMMKCGGLSRALQIVAAARACGLQVMLGCYGESVLVNSALAQLSPLVDYVDLDSHFNIRNDPFTGATVIAGRLVPAGLPGIGVAWSNA